MHSAIKTTPTHKPAPPVADDPGMDLDTPPEIMAEVLIERMSVLCARLARLKAAATAAADRDAFGRSWDGLRELRFAFDPHDRRSVRAMDLRMDEYSVIINSGRAPTITLPR